MRDRRLRVLKRTVPAAVLGGEHGMGGFVSCLRWASGERS